MDDKIKEKKTKRLIEKIKGLTTHVVKPGELSIYNYLTIDSQEATLLIDYITNLQQDNEELKKNQRYYKNGVFSLEYDKETMSDMIDDYKSRVEKAVEYIGEYKDYCDKEVCDCTPKYFEDLLDILNGRSDE